MPNKCKLVIFGSWTVGLIEAIHTVENGLKYQYVETGW